MRDVRLQEIHDQTLFFADRLFMGAAPCRGNARRPCQHLNARDILQELSDERMEVLAIIDVRTADGSNDAGEIIWNRGEER